MGLRFRRSIKIAPGVRMNIGKRGISSFSMGGLNFGGRGIYHNFKIPGTGISYRSKVMGHTKKPKSTPHPSRKREKVVMPVNLVLQDDGSVIYTDKKNRLLPHEMALVVKRQNKDFILQWLQQQCDKLNAEIGSLLRIHLTTPAPAGEVIVNPKPVPPKLKSYGLLVQLFASQRRGIDEHNRRVQHGYEQALLDWERAENALRNDVEVMSAVLSNAFSSIQWPKETLISFDIAANGSVFMDVDLPEIEDMPTQQAYVNNRDMKLTIKDRSQSQMQLDYLTHIHAIGFRLIGDVFAHLPSISTVVFSGYSQRVSKKTGQIEDEYLYSVRVPRTLWEQINFDNLEIIDVVACFEQFELRRKVTQRGIISSIEPFTG